MLGDLIGGMIALLIGCILLPEVVKQTNFHKGTELIGWTVTGESKESPKQTYLDYVKERLEIERLMK